MTDKKLSAREALIEAAQKLFCARGYSAVSTRDIAETAGVNLGSIQYHFGSKAQLFAETIKELASREFLSGKAYSVFSVHSPETELDAAAQLCLFIRRFIDDMCHPHGPQACRIMYREILGETSEDPELFEALVSSVAEEFIRPTDDYLQRAIQKLAPNLSAEERDFTVGSIIGQCAFYFTHRPFIERVRRVDVGSKDYFERAVRHAGRFSLRALGCTKQLIDAALEIADQADA